ncbi:succinylglutamate desuccinylase/aspartoacylase family protein [Paenibacillus foliorum]|nr:succinylglutamate desuccinylase/aspartoacylase family protein [Paenibacillus foliorum]
MQHDTPSSPITDFVWDRSIRNLKRSRRLSLFSEKKDDDAWLPVLEISGSEEGPALLILAGVHGDEYEGVDVILRLFHSLSPEEVKGSLLMIPTANPYAYLGGSRTSPEDTMNLARVFPGSQEGTVTERLAYELHNRFIANAEFMLDLHSGGTHYAVATLAGYYHDKSTDFGRKCREAAEAFGAKVLWGHSEVAPGRTVSSAQSLGIPWIYTEAYGGRRIRPEDKEFYYNGSIRLLRHLGMIRTPDSGENENVPIVSRTIYGDGNFDKSALSEADGFFIPEVSLLSEVRRGDRIGTIYGLDGAELQQVISDSDGIVVMLLGTPAVRKQEPIYLLASLA